MKDWLEVVSKLSERFGYRDGVLTMPGYTLRFDSTETNPMNLVDSREGHSFVPPPLNAKFAEAVACYRNGRDAHLISYLFYDGPLGRAEKLTLARLLTLPPKDARIKHKKLVRFAATMAHDFYREICDECKRLGVSYRGYADNIRRGSAKVVADVVEGVTAKEILDVMSRASTRRSLGDDSVEVVQVVFRPLRHRPLRIIRRLK
jgi:hypothetical protein